MAEKITYRDLEDRLLKKLEFKCGTVTAKTVEGKTYFGKYPVLYEVFSYDTRIAFVMDVGNEEIWVVNEHKYSNTTSKVQNVLRSMLGSYLSCINEGNFLRYTNLIWDN